MKWKSEWLLQRRGGLGRASRQARYRVARAAWAGCTGGAQFWRRTRNASSIAAIQICTLLYKATCIAFVIRAILLSSAGRVSNHYTISFVVPKTDLRASVAISPWFTSSNLKILIKFNLLNSK
jgi:hypothetical protein